MEITVYLQNNDYVKSLETERDYALEELCKFKTQFKRLETRLGDAQRINIELVDLLRAHGIRFRPSSEISTWNY